MFDPKQRAYSEWLVVRSQQGDPKAFKLLIEFWEYRLQRYAFRRLNDAELAKDVTQECLLAVSRGLMKLKDPAAFPKWLFQIQERRCADSLKRVIRQEKYIKDVSELPEYGKTDNTENEVSTEKLLSSFDTETQRVLRLYYLEGFTIKEIGEILHTPSGTVKSKLFYARKKLAQKIDS